MNPLDMMKFKGMFEKFVTRHPMLPKFFARIQPEFALAFPSESWYAVVKD